eukprot:gene15-biopygen9875
MGVRVDERSGRVTHVELKEKGLVGPIPKVLADLTELEYLDLRTNGKVVRPAGLEPSEAHPTGELGLLDMTGQVHYTTKERCQAFLQHLKKSDADQRMAVAATQLVSKHGPDGPALWTFFNANGKFPGWEAQAGRQRWFVDGVDDISKWHGVEVAKEISGGGGDGGVAGAGLLRVVGLKLAGFGLKDGFSLEGLDSLPNLKIVDFAGCKSLTTLPAELGQLSNLASLNLEGCSRLTTLPAELGQLSNLASLNLYGCSSLTTLPAELGQLSNLPSLDLSFCTSLTTLPAELGQLSNLASLDVAGCTSLTTLPAELGQLSNLASLDLWGCRSLTTLPAELGQLSNLASLDLRECTSLTTLPAELGQLSNLATLNLAHCSSLAEPFPDVSHLLPALKIENADSASAAAKAWVARGCTQK